MSILNYLKHKNVFPVPNGPLSLCLLSQAIALPNNEVAKPTKDNKKHGKYKKHRLNQTKLNSSMLHFMLLGTKAVGKAL